MNRPGAEDAERLMVKGSSASSSEFEKSGNYEAMVVEIERIIARIEAGELELEEIFEQFATAVEYLRECEGFLQSRQQQVDLLIETLQDE